METAIDNLLSAPRHLQAIMVVCLLIAGLALFKGLAWPRICRRLRIRRERKEAARQAATNEWLQAVEVVSKKRLAEIAQQEAEKALIEYRKPRLTALTVKRNPDGSYSPDFQTRRWFNDDFMAMGHVDECDGFKKLPIPKGVKQWSREPKPICPKCDGTEQNTWGDRIPAGRFCCCGSCGYKWVEFGGMSATNAAAGYKASQGGEPLPDLNLPPAPDGYEWRLQTMMRDTAGMYVDLAGNYRHEVAIRKTYRIVKK